jgi:hypothetical protein
MPQRLSQVELDEVSLVDVPANQMAKVVLMKRAEDVVHKLSGVKFVIGFKEEGGSEVQSVLFETKKWTAEKARAWLKEHDLTSEKLDENENTLRFRQHEPDKYTRLRTITPGQQLSKALRQRQSFSQLQSLVDAKLRQVVNINGDSRPSYIFMRDFFKDSVVYDHDGVTYRIEYEVDSKQEEPVVTFGTPIPVEVVYQDVNKDYEEDEDEDEDEENDNEDLAMRKRLQARIEAIAPLSERLAKVFEAIHNQLNSAR